MIFCIVGPTASHKSELAERIAIEFNAIVINFDAFQVYKEMNLGTAKPSEDFLNNHDNYFMYNFRSIKDPYNVFLYQKDARKLLEQYKNENIVLVGGTGLYLKALLYDYRFEEEEKMPEDYLENFTSEELYQLLLKIDKDDALKIGPNNLKRLKRSIYISEIHNKTKTEINNNLKDSLLYENVCFVGICPPREELYESINSRVDIMFENGLKEEAKSLLSINGVNQALHAIGYKEFSFGLDDEETKELIKKNTRNYAKRQLTFFRHQFKDVTRFEDLDEAFLYAKSRY